MSRKPDAPPPPTVNLRMRWKGYNGVQVVNHETILSNLRLTPLDDWGIFDEFVKGLCYTDFRAWCAAIGRHQLADSNTFPRDYSHMLKVFRELENLKEHLAQKYHAA